MKLGRDEGVGVGEIEEVRGQDIECTINAYACNTLDYGRELSGKNAYI